MPRTFELNTPEEEAAIQSGIAQDQDNPEWTDEDFARARPAVEVLPSAVYAALTTPRRRGLGMKPAKVQVTLRLDREVVDRLRASGSGWQGRVNQALRALVKA